MSFRKEGNKRELWQNYCHKNTHLINDLELYAWVFRNEKNFREFATYGKRLNQQEESYSFLDLYNENAKLYWKLFDFINDYFEMDAIQFDAFKVK